MASSGFDATGIVYINEIQDLLNHEDYDNMIKKIIELTKLLFSSGDLIYSKLNDEFEQSNLMIKLFDCMNVVKEQYQRDILRLLNIFLKTNKNLRLQATVNEKCLQILLKKLSNLNTWKNLDKIKYYANLSSYLLIEKKTQVDTQEIQKIVKQILNEIKEGEDQILKKINLMMLQSSIEINAGYDTNKDENQENIFPILTKIVIGIFEDWIRDYLHDFKLFYENSDSNKSRFDKYNLRVEYGFDQICRCIVHYANTPQVRMDIYQSGLYNLMDLILLLNFVPEHFMLNAIKVFEIPCLDSSLKGRFPVEHSTIINRLKIVQTKYSCKIKEQIEDLLKKYDCNSPLTSTESGDNSFSQKKHLITSPTSTQKPLTDGINSWGELDVDQWLSENNLEKCRQPLFSLTGRGLNQLKILMKEKGGKFQLIELLLSKLNLDLVTVFELLGALELLNID